MKLLIATKNKGKRHEFESLLADVFEDVHVHDLRDWPQTVADVIEDGQTFEHNAVKKALEFSQQTGISTLADDSGLAVDALDGAPGVYSARFAGPDGDDQANNAKLVHVLADVPEEQRSARYVAVLAMCLLPGHLQDRALAGLNTTMDQLTERPLSEITPDQPARRGNRLLFCQRATCEGQIILQPRGEGGFGYDPYFLIPAWDLTFAEVPLARKNTISHRAKATRQIQAVLTGTIG